ncbi:MAG: D-alanine--D-alanine ligase [Desulfarculus sp.]|nr:D-alanine--D-alanine ligase [Desulfarculus sp.]
MPTKLRLALLMGGGSSEREVSLKSGRAVLANLDPARYQTVVFDPSCDLARLVDEAPNLDLALVMLHGRGGEDGSLQGLLDLLGIPYQCAGVLGCALAMHKPLAKDRYRLFGLPVAPDVVVERGQERPLPAILEKLGLPVVVKPALEGSSFGISVVRRVEELDPALDRAFALDHTVLVEKFLPGREVTGAVLGNRELEPLPLVEIIPGEKYQFFDFEAKYTPGASHEICPARLDAATTAQIQDLACRAHQALGLKGYSRSDFILTSEGPVLLETNTIPGMTATSLLPQAAAAAGLSFSQLLDRLIELALRHHQGK